jgi:hypothetical protein
MGQTTMTAGAKAKTPPQAGVGKTASTRLLDLLAGWSAYVSADEENNVLDPALSAEEIGALYQLAGELTAWPGGTGDGCLCLRGKVYPAPAYAKG